MYTCINQLLLWFKIEYGISASLIYKAIKKLSMRSNQCDWVQCGVQKNGIVSSIKSSSFLQDHMRLHIILVNHDSYRSIPILQQNPSLRCHLSMLVDGWPSMGTAVSVLPSSTQVWTTVCTLLTMKNEPWNASTEVFP